MFLSLTCDGKFKKKVLITVLVFSVSPTQSCYATRTQAWQFCNEPKLKPKTIFFPSIRKFSAHRKVSHLNIKSDSRQARKALLCRHAGCTLRDLCISNVRTPPTSWTETEGVALMTPQPLLGNSIDQRCEQHTSVKPVYTRILQPGVCLTNVFKHVRNVTHLCLCVSLCPCA